MPPRIAIINFALNIRTIGALNLSSYLRGNGFPNHLLYAPVKHGVGQFPQATLDGIASALEPIAPVIIGFSVTSVYYRLASQVTAYLKKRFPSSIMVWGGVHPTLAPDESIGVCDALCLGEGEETFLEFVKGIETNRAMTAVSGMWVREGDRISRNEVRSLDDAIDNRPYPSLDWEKTMLLTASGEVVPMSRELFIDNSELKRRMYDIMVSRGCPLSCTYCSNSGFKKLYFKKGKILRFRSVGHVMSELEYMKKTFPETEMINFQDDAFGAAPQDYMEEFCREFKKHIALPFHLRFIPGMVTEDRIVLLKNAGLVSAVMGLQSSDRINREVFHRPVTQEQFIRAGKIMHRHGISGRYDAITSNPYGNEEDEIEVIKTFMEIPKPYALYVYPLAFFPFTVLTDRALQDGFYDPKNAGYDQPYGDYWQMRYPILARLLTLTPYTPAFVVLFFLKIVKTWWGKALFQSYWVTIGKVQRSTIDFLKARYGRMMFVKHLFQSVRAIDVPFRKSCLFKGRKENSNS